VHRINIEINAYGLPLPSELHLDDAISLPEKATTLELLFRFCYPERHPDLASLDFEVLAPLAEAAEKYKVFAAMNVCHLRMKSVHSFPDGPGPLLKCFQAHPAAACR
jgi:hypothetical protein